MCAVRRPDRILVRRLVGGEPGERIPCEWIASLSSDLFVVLRAVHGQNDATNRLMSARLEPDSARMTFVAHLQPEKAPDRFTLGYDLQRVADKGGKTPPHDQPGHQTIRDGIE